MNPNDPNQTDEAFAELAFRQLDRPEPSVALERKVAEIPLRHPAVASGFWPFERLLPALFGLAGAGMLGLLAGTLLPPAVEGGTFDEVAASSEALDAELRLVSELDWTDATEQAFALGSPSTSGVSQ